jgi:hypothetical protein
VALDERGDGFVVIDCARRVKKLLRHAQLGFPGKERREAGGQDFRRDQEHQPIGHFDEAAAGEDVGLALGIVRADELIADAESAGEISGPWLLRDEGIGAGFDDTSVDIFGAENAAEARGGFVEDVVDGSARVVPMFFEREGGREA